MGKIHLLLKKEEIDPDRLKENKVAVVFDILLATSTITAGLQYGARDVIPVLNRREAEEEAAKLEEGSYVLAGEYEGRTIDGFLSPNPLVMREKVEGKRLILSTTNGTVAIKKASGADRVYVASLLNGKAVADRIRTLHRGETILLICSGSAGEFNMEDFYGAGYLLHCLMPESVGDWELTDPARTALHFYRGNRSKGEAILKASRVGRMLARYGFDKEIRFVAREGMFDVVPYLKNKTHIVREEEVRWKS
ncbi:MAG: 2-phosphosulfolactate phosphatase [Bacillaceae bacterium]|nr:2-phosphosulfolactate phosphatase [Bacillaceae bacterium]